MPAPAGNPPAGGAPKEGGAGPDAGGGAISQEEYDALPPAEQENYEQGPDGKYHPKEKH